MIAKFFSRKTEIMPMFANMDEVPTTAPEWMIEQAIETAPILPHFSPKTEKIFRKAARTGNFAPLYAEVRAIFGCCTDELPAETFRAMYLILRDEKPGIIF